MNSHQVVVCSSCQLEVYNFVYNSVEHVIVIPALTGVRIWSCARDRFKCAGAGVNGSSFFQKQNQPPIWLSISTAFFELYRSSMTWTRPCSLMSFRITFRSPSYQTLSKAFLKF